MSDLLGELDEHEHDESDSEVDFNGYVDMRDSEQGEPPVEELVVEQMDVGATMDVGFESGSDDNDIPEYTLQPGCTNPVRDNNRPLHYLSHFVTDDMLEHIVVQIYLYAQQYVENHDLSPHSRVRQWSKGVFDINELRRFLAQVVSVLSTIHDDTPVPVQRRSQHTPGGQEILQKPQAVVECKLMGGVDH